MGVRGRRSIFYRRRKDIDGTEGKVDKNEEDFVR
jgi:hypothetical protein